MNTLTRRSALLKWTTTTLAVVALAACSSTPDKPRPAELGPSNALLGVRQAWQSRVGEVNFPLHVRVLDGQLAVASSDGTVAMLSSDTGHDLWRVQLDEAISAGVGSDGQTTAVVTRNNQLIALSAQGK